MHVVAFLVRFLFFKIGLMADGEGPKRVRGDMPRQLISASYLEREERLNDKEEEAWASESEAHGPYSK